MNHAETFFELHKGPAPLLTGNVWDVGSAIAFEKSGYKAIATSSAALANALGYEDGENLPVEWLLEAVKRIIARVNIPLSVDMERGYSNTIQGIVENVDRLYGLGAVGMNIEDSVRGAARELQPVSEFCKKLEALSNHLAQRNMKFFVNARTDAYLTGHPSPLAESVARAGAYENAGANGVFVPFALAAEDIKTIVQATSLPVHVMYHQQLPPFKELGQLGVRRVSMGPFVYRSMMAALDKHIQAIRDQQAYQAWN